eukprot:CAMPEP_0196801330 /NCGR_PEP_ID=MMETSP1362-20130617/1085_1 /TAXON_ID=163516 /ORGANISM="Leptocylindrus danicus, Strain CCMP1856" /LENGTH=159 /DNA_ID=CAMNT_0042172233 /DNA_START=101 /DNA_END=580 /DNA_ORIENTATION=-
MKAFSTLILPATLQLQAQAWTSLNGRRLNCVQKTSNLAAAEESENYWLEHSTDGTSYFFLLDNALHLTDAAELQYQTPDADDDWYGSPCASEEECEQCEIPAELKDIDAHSDIMTVDVLDYLGLKRAEPLRPSTKTDEKEKVQLEQRVRLRNNVYGSWE